MDSEDQEIYNGVFPQRMISYGGTIIAGNLAFRQTLFEYPAAVEATTQVRDGYGEGAFVGILGIKNR